MTQATISSKKLPTMDYIYTFFFSLKYKNSVISVLQEAVHLYLNCLLSAKDFRKQGHLKSNLFKMLISQFSCLYLPLSIKFLHVAFCITEKMNKTRRSEI